MPGLPESEYQRREAPVLSIPEITPDLTIAMSKAGFQMLRRNDLPSVEEPLSRLHPVIRVDEVMDYFLTAGERDEAQNFGGWLYFQKEDPRTRLNTITRVGYRPVHPQNAMWSAVWGLQMDTMLDLEQYATTLNTDSAQSLVPSQEALDQILHDESPRVGLVSRKDLPLSNRNGRAPIYMGGKLFYSHYLVVNEPYPFSNNGQVMQNVERTIVESVASQEEFIGTQLANVNVPDKSVIKQALDKYLESYPGQPIILRRLAQDLDLPDYVVRKVYHELETGQTVPLLGSRGVASGPYGSKVTEQAKIALESVEKDIDLMNLLEEVKILPAVLIARRVALKMSQEALAQKIGVDKNQIQRYEATNYSSISLHRILNIIAVLKDQEPVEIPRRETLSGAGIVLSQILDKHLSENPDEPVTISGLHAEINEIVSKQQVYNLYHLISSLKEVPGLKHKREIKAEARKDFIEELKNQFEVSGLYKQAKKVKIVRTPDEREKFNDYLVQLRNDPRDLTDREISQITNTPLESIRYRMNLLRREGRITSKR